MLKLFAFLGLSFASAVVLSIVIGLVIGLIQRRKQRRETCKNLDLTDDPGDLLKDLHEDLL